MIETLAMGGAENLAVSIANSLALAGHDSHLIVITRPDVLSGKIDSRVSVHYLHFDRASIRNPVKFLVSLWRGNRLIAGLITAKGIAAVQTHLPGSNFWGLLLALRKKCAVFATVHNNEEFRYGDRDNALLAFMRKQAYKRILGSCQGVVAVSDEVRTSLIRELKAGPREAGKVAVVTNAVQVPAPLDEGRKQAVRAELGVAPDVPLVLAAGRFCEQKNFHDLVVVAGELRDMGCGFHLVIAGDGEERPALVALKDAMGLSARVTMPGNLTNLGEVMQVADIFVLSSLWEGLPLVLLEAMAAGLPVIAYGIPGVEEIMDDGQAGLTVPVGDPKALARGLAGLLEEESRRRNLGRAGRLIIEAEYSFTKLISRLEDLYAAALGPKSEGWVG